MSTYIPQRIIQQYTHGLLTPSLIHAKIISRKTTKGVPAMNRTVMSHLHTNLSSGFSVSSGKTVVLLCADTDCGFMREHRSKYV